MRVAAIALATTFAWAALAKVVRFGEWRRALVGYRLQARAFALALVAVPLMEVAAAALLLAGALRAGAALVVAMLASFSWAVARASAIGGDRVPCGCFGAMTTRDYRLVLARNLALGLAAAAILIRGQDVSPMSGFAAPRPDEVGAAALVLVGLVLVAWLARYAVALTRSDRP